MPLNPTLDSALAPFDLMYSLGTGTLAQIPAGLAAFGSYLGNGLDYDKGADAFDRTAQLFTAQPRTKRGQQAMQALGMLTDKGRPVTDAGLQKLGPVPMVMAEGLLNLIPGERVPAAAANGTRYMLRGLGGGPVEQAPLRGLPEVIDVPTVGKIKAGPNVTARKAAEQYAREAGLDYSPLDEYVKLDPERGKRVAEAFDQMPHDPDNPEVKAAYRAMIDETKAQWDAIKQTGLKVEFIKPGMADPYAASPRLAIEDVNKNNHLWVFPTDDGFGGSASAHVDIRGNPLLEKTGEKIDGREVRANDLFRIVHDYFGHVKEGIGFRAEGEDNAYLQHKRMYTPLAARAMATETRGQNSWVNFGPHAKKNRTASGADTQYAPQKIGLLDPSLLKWLGVVPAAGLMLGMQGEGDDE